MIRAGHLVLLGACSAAALAPFNGVARAAWRAPAAAMSDGGLAQARGALAEALAARSESARLASLKAEVLELAAGLERGAVADEPRAKRLSEAVLELEALNPEPAPLESPCLSGRWRLLYTTSRSILGLDGKASRRPVGPIYQSLDVASLRARNDERRRFWRVGYDRFVEADLEPLSASKVVVRFRRFGVGPLRVPAPASAVGELDTTYLDADFRVSRGDKGNLFVLRKDDVRA